MKNFFQPLFLKQTVRIAPLLFGVLFFISIFLCMSQQIYAQSNRQVDDRVADVVEMASKAIVNIKTEEVLKTESDEKKSSPSLFKKYFSSEDEVEELVENIGSGVVLDREWDHRNQRASYRPGNKYQG